LEASGNLSDDGLSARERLAPVAVIKTDEGTDDETDDGTDGWKGRPPPDKTKDII
jgi:hypothetical protein